MFGSRKKIFTAAGLDVHVDMTWLAITGIIVLETWQRCFLQYYQNETPAVYWSLVAWCAFGLAASVAFRELFHSLAARFFGTQLKSITLFVFGGVPEAHSEPVNARNEFLTAAAGPLANFLLGALFYLVFEAAAAYAWAPPAQGLFKYLAVINWTLAGFNLIPAFPLDGGRMLRSALWNWKRNFKWATLKALGIGATVGLCFIFIGGLHVISGNFMGFWFFIAGIFLRGSAEYA